MFIQFHLAGRTYAANTERAIDISIPLDFEGEQPSAFFIPPAKAWCYETEGFVGDTRRGSGCNCMTIQMTPHGNGTHTEGVGHLNKTRHAVTQLFKPSLIPTTLLTVTPEIAAEAGEDEAFLDPRDLVITERALRERFAALVGTPQEFRRGLVVRTLPNSTAKWSTIYSGKNPPYFSRAAMRLIRRWGTEHLLCDLPSVERESDGGRLAVHRIFFGGSNDPNIEVPVSQRSITEMVYVDESVTDGVYLLDLHCPPFLLEAVPSRPILFPVSALGSTAHAA